MPPGYLRDVEPIADDVPLPLVSLVVPIRNEVDYIARCLDGLVEQAYPPQLLEVLVVDGGSTDGTRRVVEQIAGNRQRIRLIDNPERSTADGLNLGIAASTGVVIGYIHGRSRVPPDYVWRGVQALHSTGAWSVGGRIIRTSSTPMQRAIAIATSSPIGVGDARHNFVDSAGEVETVFPGMWPRWVFDRVGRFDPRMLRNEDNEFSYRIRQAGGKVWLDPSIEIVYTPRATLRELFGQYRLYGAGKVRVIRKHGGAVQLRTLVPAFWVAFLIVAIPAFATVAPLRVLIAAVLLTYLAILAIGALREAAGPIEAVRVAAAFATMHFAYGVGFLWSAVTEAWSGERRRGANHDRP